MIGHEQIANMALNHLKEDLPFLRLLGKWKPIGVQATMGDSIIGQWHTLPDGNCRYESYGKKKPRYVKICIRPPGMTYEERFGRS